MQRHIEELQAWQKQAVEEGLQQQQQHYADLLASKHDELLKAQANHE